MTDLMERKREDLDRLTVAVAQGYAISMSSDALRAWQAAHQERDESAPAADAIASQRAAFGRLAAMFPGAVKIRRPD